MRYAKEEAERASKAKDQFIMNIEHDFRTPFNGICGLASLLHEEEKDPEKKETLGMIASSAQELLDDSASMLDFSRIEQGLVPLCQKKFDLHALLNRLIQIEVPAATQKNLVLTLNMDQRMPKGVIADEYRLFRILINLVSNAIKFTESGSVILAVQLRQVMADPRKAVIEFVVADTGIGIHEEQKAYIFEKYTHSTLSTEKKYRGLGLGLRSVKQFTQDMGGDIEVSSSPHQGTVFCCTFLFELPLTDHFIPSQEKGV